MKFGDVGSKYVIKACNKASSVSSLISNTAGKIASEPLGYLS